MQLEQGELVGLVLAMVTWMKHGLGLHFCIRNILSVVLQVLFSVLSVATSLTFRIPELLL